MTALYSQGSDNFVFVHRGDQAEARRVLIEEAGTRLDPKAVSALFTVLDHHVETFASSSRVALAF